MANPFYVKAGPGWGPGLSGLADTISKGKDRKREEEAAQAKIAKEEAAAQAQKDQEMAEQQEISDVMSTNDPVKIKAVMAKYPKKAAGLKAAIETKFPGKSKDDYMNALFSAGTNISDAPQVAEDLKKVFMADGIIDQEEAAKIDKVKASTPEELKKIIDSELALVTSATGNEKLWEQYQDINGGGGTNLPTTAMGQFIKNNPNATSEQLIEFTQKLKAGETDVESWGQVKEGIDELGNPVSFVTDKGGNVKILEKVQPSPKKGMKIYDREGNLMVDMSGGAVDGELPRGTKTALFSDVFDAQNVMDDMEYIDNLYEQDFLTYGGMWQSLKSTMLNKLDPNDRDAFTQRRSAFMSATNQAFLKYRKWATGVAGGEKEMAQIERSIPNEKDSPQDWEAKAGLRKSLTRRFIARQKAALKAGVNSDKEFREYLKVNPIDSIPTLQERGDTLNSQGYTKEQVIALLREEGYIRGNK